jgi:hypothetical protein
MTLPLSPIIIISLILVLAIIFKIWRRHHNNKIIAESTDLHRGTASEREIILKLRKFGIKAQDIYHDLYFRRRNGTYVQVDMVVPTEVGIIVFELKDYKGWIFGDGNHNKWTQVLNYGRVKNLFYNPVMQNEGHIFHMRELCPQLRNVPIYSVIVFSGDCRFRKMRNIPQDVHIIYDSKLKRTLKSIFKNPTVSYQNKAEIVRFLEQAKANGADSKTVAEHIEYVRSRHGHKHGSHILFKWIILSPFRMLRIVLRIIGRLF